MRCAVASGGQAGARGQQWLCAHCIHDHARANRILHPHIDVARYPHGRARKNGLGTRVNGRSPGPTCRCHQSAHNDKLGGLPDQPAWGASSQVPIPISTLMRSPLLEMGPLALTRPSGPGWCSPSFRWGRADYGQGRAVHEPDNAVVCLVGKGRPGGNASVGVGALEVLVGSLPAHHRVDEELLQGNESRGPGHDDPAVLPGFGHNRRAGLEGVLGCHGSVVRGGGLGGGLSRCRGGLAVDRPAAGEQAGQAMTTGTRGFMSLRRRVGGIGSARTDPYLGVGRGERSDTPRANTRRGGSAGGTDRHTASLFSSQQRFGDW